MNKGLEIFAEDPKKGMKYFEKNGLVEMTPESDPSSECPPGSLSPYVSLSLPLSVSLVSFENCPRHCHVYEGVADFFHKTKGLNKKQIGDYIGRSKDFNKSVLHAFTDALDFRELSYDQSIRLFLNGFRLPGEVPSPSRCRTLSHSKCMIRLLVAPTALLLIERQH